MVAWKLQSSQKTGIPVCVGGAFDRAGRLGSPLEAGNDRGGGLSVTRRIPMLIRHRMGLETESQPGAAVLHLKNRG